MKKNKFKILIFLMLLILLIQFLPKLSLKTISMKSSKIDGLNIYYEKADKKVITDISNKLEKDIDRINKKLKFKSNKNTNLYIYPNQNVFHRKKYGFYIEIVKLFNNIDWYIGDNVKDNIIMVSPLNPGKYHTYKSVINAIPHEYVHTVIYRLNPNTPLWINEGIALYLTNGEKLNNLDNIRLPKFEEIQTESSLEFSKIGGYQLAHTYIEYLENEFGFNSIINFLKEDLSYKKAFGLESKEIYENWILYLTNK